MLSLNLPECAISELQNNGDLVLMSETIDGLRDEFLKRKEAFKSKGLKDNLRKTTVMVCGGITKDGMSKSKVDPCGSIESKGYFRFVFAVW